MLARLLAATPPPTETLSAWWDATASERVGTTIDRALIGGAFADRLAFAFASGYAEALRALVPANSPAGEPIDGIGALCATEEGGAHPRAIQTTLVDGRLTGKKKWATAANRAQWLLVVASIGEEAGKNRLKVARVAANAPGVTMRASAAPFVPEIEHCEIELANVEVADVLPGDGYDDYLKPFRTVEDLHVHAALIGYLIGVARRKACGPGAIETLLALAASTRGLLDADRKSPATHLALAGLFDAVSKVAAEIEQHWPHDDEWQRWQRDRMLLQTAGKARATRRENARATL